MFKNIFSIRFLYVALGLAFGASLGPSLSSCNVTGGLTDYDNNELHTSENSLSQLKRFKATYDKFVIPGSKNDRTYSKNMDQFRDALLRIRHDYVRDVPVSDLVNAAIEGMESSDQKLEPGRVEPDFLIEVALDKMLTSLDPSLKLSKPS